MIEVKLTKRGYTAACEMVGHDGHTLVALTAHASIRQGVERVWVSAPYVAWRNAQQDLIVHCYGPQGGKRAEVAGRYVTALKSITKDLNYIDTHPAMSGKGALGLWGLTIPAWSNGETFSAYPQPGERFIILTPVWERAKDGRPLTRWEALDGDALHENIHLLLCRQPV